MSFEQLPQDWDHAPLTDPDRAADIIDLFLSLDDRRRNCLLILLCDEDARLLQPICIEDVDWLSPPDERLQAFRMVAEHFALPFVAAVSTWRSFPPDVALDWRQSAQEAIDRWGGTLLGWYVATGRGVVQLPEAVLR